MRGVRVAETGARGPGALDVPCAGTSGAPARRDSVSAVCGGNRGPGPWRSAAAATRQRGGDEGHGRREKIRDISTVCIGLVCIGQRWKTRRGKNPKRRRPSRVLCSWRARRGTRQAGGGLAERGREERSLEEERLHVCARA